MTNGRLREIRIVGGGLAGLSLGIALRRRGVPTRVLEAGRYPRHKVCGEFIAGLAEEVVAELGIGQEFAGALQHREVAWFRSGEVFRRDRLPMPALGISRYELDRRLAARFQELGGCLETGRRCSRDEVDFGEGVVWAAGRVRARSDWMGIKLHCHGLRLAADLEVHLGDEGYAGASAVEGGRVNVCALIRRRPGLLGGSGSDAFFQCLKAAGLGDLAERVEGAEPDLQSRSAVAGLAFGKVDGADGGCCIQVGDAFALIPPFTGDGMAMAFEGAAVVVGPLAQYARGQLSWETTARQCGIALDEVFRRRLAVAGAVHPFLYRAGGQRAFRAASVARLLPFRPLFRLLH